MDYFGIAQQSPHHFTTPHILTPHLDSSGFFLIPEIWWHSTTERQPISERLPYISLLRVKDKCFYLQTKWAFTGISGLW